MNYLIDRRLNGRNKSAVNRERFIRRYKEHIRRAVKGMIAERSITDMAKGGDVKVPAKDISEPGFRYGSGGDWETVHPGNKEFVRGDKIPRPEGGGGGKGGSQSGSGASVDDFVFTLSRDEFLNIFFEDLELPNLMRTAIAEAEDKKLVRAGYVKEGTPCNLSVAQDHEDGAGAAHRAGRPGQGRAGDRCARSWRRPASEGQPQTDIDDARNSASWSSRGVSARLPFLDDVDLRYRHRVAVPTPSARAVMFCLMDVSASMDERKKDLAKRFFTLLYLFLTRKYERVELVFIRHTDEAQEVDEDTFFYDTQSGGTVVFSALELMQQICAARYPKSEWNIYAAQASDGDAFGADPAKSARFLREYLLPIDALLRLHRSARTRTSRATAACGWSTRSCSDPISTSPCGACSSPQEIYPVFRDLFRKEKRCERPYPWPLAARPGVGLRAARALRRGDRGDRRRVRARHLPEPDRDHQLRADARRLRLRAACRSAIRTGPTARRSSATSSPIARGIRVSPTRS